METVAAYHEEVKAAMLAKAWGDQAGEDPFVQQFRQSSIWMEQGAPPEPLKEQE